MKIKVIIAIAFILLLFFPAFLIIYGCHDRLAKVDVAVIFGNKVNPDGTLSNRLKARLDKGVDLFNIGYFRKIIVSGGIGKEGFDEAQKMKEYLISTGIPDSSIVEDNSGKNSWATALFVREFLRKNNLQSVMVITQYFHIFRSKLALKKAGVTTLFNAHADFFELQDLLSTARECIAVVKYAFKR
jgi:vancomycin permeability regulator SanA